MDGRTDVRQAIADALGDSPMPDRFDRLLGQYHGLPGGLTQPQIIREVSLLGVGGSSLFVVQTARLDDGDVVFLQTEDPASGRLLKLVLPPSVTRALVRQHDSLIGKARKRSAQQGYETRKAKGTQATPPPRPKKKGAKR
jgi:hypothetical protein